MREDVDEEDVYSVIVTAFIEEKDRELKFIARPKNVLKRRKNEGLSSDQKHILCRQGRMEPIWGFMCYSSHSSALKGLNLSGLWID